jgi:hypothetical protein
MEALLFNSSKRSAVAAIEIEPHCRYPPRRLTSLGLKTPVQLAGITRQLGHVDRGPQLAHEPGSVPGRAAGQFFAFKQHHILNARLGQVISHRNTNDAATYNNDLTTIWQRRH